MKRKKNKENNQKLKAKPGSLRALRIALSVYSFASIGMRETVRDVETGEKCLGNSEYHTIFNSENRHTYWACLHLVTSCVFSDRISI